jgi:SpoIID/LytB domain protein
MNIFKKHSYSIILFFSSCLILVSLETAPKQARAVEDLNLQVGIVQRFGDRPIDEKDEIVSEIEILSPQGDILTVSSLETAKPSQIITTKKVFLKTTNKPLNKPILSEKIVLGSHATFETAENDANFWRSLGIEVEIVQPGRWQVWAKRDVYDTPLIRRWLLESLEDNGYNVPYLDSKVIKSLPQVSLSIDGQNYYDNEFEITTKTNRVLVNTVSNLQKASHLYGGSLRLQPNAYNNFSLVNNVPLETYLRGVVPYEIGANAPAEAIAAQTIIARTYALRNLRRFIADDYQLCATVHCQVYRGISGATPVTDTAIANTQGLVLTYKNELVDALYSSTTGGITASFSDVWEGAERPYLKPIIDAPQPVWDLSRYPLVNEKVLRNFLGLKQGFNETGLEVFRWQKERKISDLNGDLKKYLTRVNHPLADFTNIKSLEIVKRSQSGRILTLLVDTDLGNIKLHKNEVRSAFEPPKSTLFYLDPVYNQNKQLEAYIFTGGGFGHGVGLSQNGSYNLAKLGWSAAQILAFYYPETTIKLLDNSIIFWQDTEQIMSQTKSD